MALELTRLRLRNQRLSGAALTRPEDVVGWMGAVQAQEYADAKWALALRMRRATEAVIERAITEGRILRTHVLRPTWHFVAPADIRWMLALTGPCVSRRMAPYNRRLELDAATFERSQKAIARALDGGMHLTRQELKTVLKRAGIQADSVQRLAHIVMQAELDGVVCSGPRRNKLFTYALFDKRVPPSRARSRDDALAELTRRYFTSHGPAQIPDFVWWSGLTTADARHGLEMVRRDLAQDTISGKTYWFPSSMRATAPLRAAYLLPLYDEFLIVYKDRSAALDLTLWKRIVKREPFSSAILLGGRVVGGWTRRVSGDSVSVALDLPVKLKRSDERLVVDAASRLAAFVGLPLNLKPRRLSEDREGKMRISR